MTMSARFHNGTVHMMKNNDLREVCRVTGVPYGARFTTIRLLYEKLNLHPVELDRMPVIERQAKEYMQKRDPLDMEADEIRDVCHAAGVGFSTAHPKASLQILCYRCNVGVPNFMKLLILLPNTEAEAMAYMAPRVLELLDYAELCVLTVVFCNANYSPHLFDMQAQDPDDRTSVIRALKDIYRATRVKVHETWTGPVDCLESIMRAEDDRERAKDDMNMMLAQLEQGWGQALTTLTTVAPVSVKPSTMIEAMQFMRTYTVWSLDDGQKRKLFDLLGCLGEYPETEEAWMDRLYHQRLIVHMEQCGARDQLDFAPRPINPMDGIDEVLAEIPRSLILYRSHDELNRCAFLLSLPEFTGSFDDIESLYRRHFTAWCNRWEQRLLLGDEEAPPPPPPPASSSSSSAKRQRAADEKVTLSCAICMENGADRFVVFQCGHSACAQCSAKLVLCHMCRDRIVTRIEMKGL